MRLKDVDSRICAKRELRKVEPFRCEQAPSSEANLLNDTDVAKLHCR